MNINNHVNGRSIFIFFKMLPGYMDVTHVFCFVQLYFRVVQSNCREVHCSIQSYCSCIIFLSFFPVVVLKKIKMKIHADKSNCIRFLMLNWKSKFHFGITLVYCIQILLVDKYYLHSITLNISFFGQKKTLNVS